MNFIRHFGICAASAVCAALFAFSASASAAVEMAPQHTYNVTIKPQSARVSTFPRTGVLTLKFNSDGIVNGTYRGTSVAPDPLNNRITTVTGGLREHNLWINIGGSGLHFSGTLQHGKLSMTGLIKQQLYSLTGGVVH